MALTSLKKWPTQKLLYALGAVSEAVIPTSSFQTVNELCRKQRQWFNPLFIEQQG
jgi:hypothetical protein